MFYLIWMILNIGLAIYFYYLCFKGGHFIKEKFGSFAFVVFVFGLMSFVSVANKGNTDNEPLIKWESSMKDDSLVYHPTELKEIILSKNLMFSIGLSVHYTSINGIKKPHSARCFLNGTTGNYDWKANYINIQESSMSENLYKYYIIGTSVLRLLWVDIQSSSKVYEGVIKL